MKSSTNTRCKFRRKYVIQIAFICALMTCHSVVARQVEYPVYVKVILVKESSVSVDSPYKNILESCIRRELRKIDRVTILIEKPEFESAKQLEVEYASLTVTGNQNPTGYFVVSNSYLTGRLFNGRSIRYGLRDFIYTAGSDRISYICEAVVADFGEQVIEQWYRSYIK